MAFKPEDLPNGVPANANYPSGSGQDETNPGVSDDGTPLVAAVYNDVQGFLQGLIHRENIAPSGVSDTVPLSDYRDGLGRTITRGGDVVTVAAGGTAILGKINRPNNAGGPITIKLPLAGLYAGATVAFDPNPPQDYYTAPVTWDAQTETIGDTAQTVELRTRNLQGGFRRDATNTKWVPFKNMVTGTRI